MAQELRRSLAVVLALSALGCRDDVWPEHVVLKKADLLSAVDPRIGTGGDGFGVGSTYPGPALPFSMIHPSPDTRTEKGAFPPYHCSGYYATDPLLRAFSLVHFEGTGVPDYGAIGLVPTDGMTDAKRVEDGYMQPLDKKTETTLPGYYSVTLENGIKTEITSSRRAAIFRFGFPAGVKPVLLLALDHRLAGAITEADVALDPAGAFDAHVRHEGSMTASAGGYDLYARGVLDVVPSAVGTFDGEALHPGQATASGTPLGAWIELPPGTQEARLRIAISFVDADGAKKNLNAEAPSFDFEGLRADAEAAWRKEFESLELWGASDRDTTVMGTALYHALLMPTLMSDVDGRFVNAKLEVASGKRARYNDLSLWDTYRTLHPWLLLAEDPRNEDFAASMVAMAAEGGAVPVWGIAHGDSKTMVGSPGEIVLAESAQKGVTFDDEEAAYELARVSAYGPSPGPVGGRDEDLPAYMVNGYVPSDVSDGSVSKTQEYAVADAALGRWAERLGRAGDAAELGARGSSWKALFDPQEGFFRAKKSDGSWASPTLVPTLMDKSYVEGNAWHYLWMVPHDPDGLAETLGGKDAALGRLRELFEASVDEVPVLGVRKYYWHSNEPDINAAWLFAAWGSPGESFRWVDWIVTKLYGTGVDGIPGNDDGGTLSAWLLFAATGLYPISGTDRYIVSAPRYGRVVVRRPSGDLVIEATEPPRPGLAPERVLLDGEPLGGPSISHAELEGSHVLTFEMAEAS